MAASAEQRVLDLIKSRQTCTPEEFLSLFDQLSPVTPADMLAEWNADYWETGHPMGPFLRSIKWIGKSFWSEQDVEPIVVESEDGRRQFYDEWGKATVVEAKYRGVVSAAMVYDKYPIFDHFRRVSDTAVMGIMDSKMYEGKKAFFFMTK